MVGADFVFYASLTFLVGVGLAGLHINIFIVSGFALLIILGFLFFCRRWISDKKFLLLLLWLLLFSGVFYYYFFLNFKTARENIVFNQEFSFSGIVVDEPRFSEKAQIFTVSLEPPLNGEIDVVAPRLPEFRYGELLKIEGRITPSIGDAEKPEIVFPKIIVAAEDRGFWLKEKLLLFKKNLLAQFQNVLPADQAALLGGITFGSRSSFSKDFKEWMALSGTTHLVALSGYNIAILVLAAAQVFGYFFSKRKTFYLTAAVIILFVLMVGAEASVVRAAIMGFLALLAKEVGRLYSMRNIIMLTAILMTLINPVLLIYNVGFQLSFLSLLGIVYLGPSLKSVLKIGDNGGFLNWRENFVTTASAQLAVLPVVIQAFGRFSLTAVLANALILGFIPITMFFGFLLAALSSLFFYFGFLVAKLVELLLFYEILIIKLFAKISLPIKIFSLNPALVFFVYYVFLVAFIFYSRKNEKV